MNSEQRILEIIEKIEGITGKQIQVFSMEDQVYSVNGMQSSGTVKSLVESLASSEAVQYIGNKAYLEVFDGTRLTYLVESDGDEKGLISLKFAGLQLTQLLTLAEDRIGRENFIKNLLLDNLLLVDIYSRAKQIHISTRARRVAFIIEVLGTEDTGAVTVLKSMFGEEESDFIVAIDEKNIVYVKELKNNETETELKRIAETIVDMLNTEIMANVRVSYGNATEEIRKVSNSYKEAKLALSVGRIFKSGDKVVSYSSLGIGRLIYQLPIPMCRMFIDEIFKNQSPDDFDKETIETINEFFANSLNISETSRKLFIHRNTLVYRLDKIKSGTGLDLRVFDDAITFKIALMVVKYMHFMENQE